MTDYLALLVILIASLASLFILHAIACRVARATGHDSRPPQTIALGTILLWNVPVVLAAWRVAFRNLEGFELVCGLLFVLMTYNACGFGYFCLLNVTETSLHVNILMRLWVQNGMTLDELTARYSVKQMIAARIERMIGLGQLEERDGRYYLRNNTFLLIERVYDMWRLLLGLPRSPE
jgi:hypothetical protein